MRGSDSCSTGSECPFQGDPLDDFISRGLADMAELGYSSDEIKERINKEPYNPRIVISVDEIILDGHPLEGLNPSVRAFYILVCNHPEGLLVGQFHDEYLDEYKDIFQMLKRKRVMKKHNDMSFELDKRAKRYRDDIKKSIEKIEREFPGLNLSRCKIYGTERWIVQTRDIHNLMGINSHIDL